MLSAIYFINTPALAKKLALDQISDSVAFLHFVLHAILVSAAIPYKIDMNWAGEKPDAWLEGIFSFLLFSVIQYWGLVRIYKINRNIDGKDFFLRYAALSLPILIQISILGLLASLVYATLAVPLAENYSSEISPTAWYLTGELFSAVLTILYFKLYFFSFHQIQSHIYKTPHD